MNMQYPFTIVAVIALLVAPVFAQSSDPPTKAADLRDIERLETQWNTINELSDYEGKAFLLAEDSYHVGPSGRLYNKAQDVQETESSRLEKQANRRSVKFQTLSRTIRIYENVAVVTLTMSSMSTQNGLQRAGRPFHALHVWERRDGRWFLTVDQVTAIAGHPIPSKQ